jgi:hypothetical protein
MVCMSREEDKYRALAEEAQREANRSTNEVERAAWLRVMQGWLALIRKRSGNGARQK